MSDTVILDASAILAYLNQEDGADVIEQVLVTEPLLSSVNLAEVIGKLVDRGMPMDDIREVMPVDRDTPALTAHPKSERLPHPPPIRSLRPQWMRRFDPRSVLMPQ